MQKGAYYEKVSDLLALRTLPKIVRATTAFRGSGPESSVESNELLSLRGVKKGITGRALKVFSLLTMQKKELQENCQGGFSTRPYDVRLYLPEIAEFLKEPFPVVAMLYVNAETAEELPPNMTSSTVTLKGECVRACVHHHVQHFLPLGTSVETSLIATGTIDEGERFRKLIDIPLDLDIDVQIMRPKDEDETEQLYEDTRLE